MEYHHFIFDCYDRDHRYNFRVEPVRIKVKATDEDEALAKVKTLVVRQYYDLEEINSTELL